jgi:hypothetical protein
MKSWIRATVILTALFFPLVQAQAQTDLIGAYRSIQGALEGARTTINRDPAGALARVQGAENTFRRVSNQLAPALASGGNAALKNAGVAVSRGSSADFGAQAGQIKAILERGMYERLFSVFGNVAQAGRYASALGSAFKLSSATRADLSASVRSGNADRARGILESQLASIISNALRTAQSNAGNKASAFANASRAANNFLIVQDSPRLSEISVGSFSSAIASLTSGDTAGFQQAMGVLIAQIRGFAERSRGLIASNPNRRPANTTRPATRPASPPVATRPNPSPSAATPPSSPAAAPAQPNTNALRAALVKAGIAAPRAEQLSRDLAVQGFSSIEGVLNRISIGLSDALADIQYGDISNGRAAISESKTIFDSALRPIVEATNPDLATRSSRLFEATEAAAGIRPVDITALIGEMDTIEHTLEGEPTSSLQGVVANVQPFWMGWVRGGLFLIVALLFTYPIYLLNLAFGGRNPYWRYIGVAMILLFIPPLIEGLSWLGSFLAQSVPGLGFLNGLASFSVLQNPLAQIGWVVILFATVAFATAGFRGIAAQFGLIRTRNSGASGAPTSMGTAAFSTGRNATPMDRPAMNTQQVPTTERTIVEWDEEF